jgi:AcrR family transcriptional regulator
MSLTRHTSTLSPRRQRNRDAMVEAILTVARQIMREEGVAALSMQELARRLEMRAPSLYHYFPGKTAIYNALFALGHTMFAERMQAMLAAAQTVQDEFRLSFEAYLGFAIEHPELFQLCFERPVPGFVPSTESLQVSVRHLQDAYARVASLHNKLDTDLTPVQVTDLLIAIMHGLAAQHLANEPQLALGQGRFGSLIPATLSVLTKAWFKSQNTMR